MRKNPQVIGKKKRLPGVGCIDLVRPSTEWFAEIKRLLSREKPRNAFNAFLKHSNLVFDCKPMRALGTSQLGIQPSKQLWKLLATLRASELDND